MVDIQRETVDFIIDTLRLIGWRKYGRWKIVINEGSRIRQMEVSGIELPLFIKRINWNKRYVYLFTNYACIIIVKHVDDVFRFMMEGEAQEMLLLEDGWVMVFISCVNIDRLNQIVSEDNRREKQ